MQIKIGIGYDAHRLVAQRPLVLGGVAIPCDVGLLGHSDADVLIHAIGDAVLGALGQGDLGRHFPDNDPAYCGISSLVLLEKIALMLQAGGMVCGNVDAVIVAQQPKLAPFVGRMAAVIAGCLGIASAQVNIKATTTEKMGFEGRGEGISAQAVVLIHSNPGTDHEE